MLLSIGLMVKDEEEYLEQCLVALSPILEAVESELIIVDTGSTDRTLEIARRFTNRVYEHEWTNDFAEMRNIVLSYTRGEWFFYVDADEIVTDSSGIVEFFASGRYRRYNSGAILMKNVFYKDNYDSFGMFSALRLFKNDREFHFKGIVHEQPMAKGPIAEVKGEILHYGYLNDDSELMEYKFQRNVGLLERALEDDPENIYTLFQLSQSYAMYKDYKGALSYVLKAYEHAKSDPGKYIYVLNQLANLYYRNKLFVEAEDTCKLGLELKKDNIDLYYFQAFAQIELGKLEQAVISLHKYLELVDEFERGRLQFDVSIDCKTVGNKERVYGSLCGLYNKLGQPNKALEFGNRIRSANVLEDAVQHLVAAFLKLGRLSELKSLYVAWKDNDEVCPLLEKAIEDKAWKLERDEKLELATMFSSCDTTYGMLNRVRLDYYSGKCGLGPQMLKELRGIDLADKPVYYAEFLFAGIRYGHNIYSQLEHVRNDRLSGYVTYLNGVYDDFSDYLISYLELEVPWSDDHAWKYETMRLRTALLYGLLQDNELIDTAYEKTFEMYVQCGIEFLEGSYIPRILDEGLVSWVRNGADGFLLYMRLSLNSDKGSVDYVRFLRLALSQDASMKRGIELLLKEIREDLANPIQDELDELSTSVRDSIKEAINAGELQTAVALIREYEDIVGIDAPLCSAKGIIHMIDGDLERAEESFLTGLDLEPDNADLNYNMGFLYEQREHIQEAIKYYSKSTMLSGDSSLVFDAENALKRLRDVEAGKRTLNPSSAHSVKILYLGRLGRENLGDELLYDAFRILLYHKLSPELKVVVDSLIPGQLPTIEDYEIVVLGGGSLLGLSYYGELLSEANRLGKSTIVWGSGFDIRDSQQVRLIVDEYENRVTGFRYRSEPTATLIKEAKIVGVRGRLDKLLLGLDSVRVIGDPGVVWGLLEQGFCPVPDIEAIPENERIVLVNWGTSLNNVMGDDELLVQKQLAEALRSMNSDGYRIVIYPMWPEDVEPCQKLAAQINNERVIVLEQVHDMKELAYLMERAYLSVNLKLHSNIISAAFGKPFVSLGYGLKCYDFADSVDSLDLLVFTDEVSSDAILDKVRHIEEKYETIKSRLLKHVEFYYEHQLDFMDDIVAMVETKGGAYQK